ncbi:MAG: hypothetical protein ACXWDB_07585 [Aeromicrobium sp.]
MPQAERFFAVPDDERGLPSNLDVRVAETLVPDPRQGLFPAQIIAMLQLLPMTRAVILGNPVRPADEEVDSGNEGPLPVEQHLLGLDTDPRQLE